MLIWSKLGLQTALQKAHVSFKEAIVTIGIKSHTGCLLKAKSHPSMYTALKFTQAILTQAWVPLICFISETIAKDPAENRHTTENRHKGFHGFSQGKQQHLSFFFISFSPTAGAKGHQGTLAMLCLGKPSSAPCYSVAVPADTVVSSLIPGCSCSDLSEEAVGGLAPSFSHLP